MWAIGTVAVGLGLWRMMYGIRKMKWVFRRTVSLNSEMDQERFNTRLAIAPYLQAEEDIRYPSSFGFHLLVTASTWISS